MKHFKPKFITRLGLVVTVFLLALAVLPQILTPTVAADEFDEKIKILQSEVNGYNAEAKKLAEQADTLSSAVAKLQNEQNQLQAEIDLNNAKRDDLTNKIAENEQKLKQQSKVLSETLVDLYLDGQVTPIEILASSASIGDYVDQQVQRSVVRDQVADTAKQIKTLKTQLESQKLEIEQILKDQESRKGQLVAKQNEQSGLLAATQGQEDKYRNMVGDNNKEIERLRTEQRAANARAGLVAGNSQCGGGYPYCNAPFPNSMPDPWGMYQRQCVSYTAYKVASTYGYMPYWGGHGNANQWVANAQAAGIPTGSIPRVGSVGVSFAGYYGHVVWVEQVSGNQVYISQYNAGMNGMYSEQWINASAFTYIYFGN